MRREISYRRQSVSKAHSARGGRSPSDVAYHRPSCPPTASPVWSPSRGGIAGIVLCALVPLLPVKQTTATIAWPQGLGSDGFVSDVTAPLVSGTPRALDVTIPCRAVATLPASGGLVFSTVPPAGIDASRNGVFVRANADVVVVAIPGHRRRGGAACRRQLRGLPTSCTSGRTPAAPEPTSSASPVPPAHCRRRSSPRSPVCSPISRWARMPGLSARVDIDTRFITHADAAQAGGHAAGHRVRGRLDRRAGSARPPQRAANTARLAATPAGARSSAVSTWLADAGVVGTLLLWHLIGPLSSDDGYNLTIARVSSDDRIRRQLLPLLRRHRGALRLVPVRARPLRRRQHRQRVDAHPRHRWPESPPG